MHRSLKRNLVIGLAALATAAFAGGAYAATQNSGPSTRQAFLNDVAKRLHVTPEQLTAALNGAADDQLQAAVKAGQLTQAQANALAQRLKKGGPGRAFPLGPIGPIGPIGPLGPLGPRARVAPFGPGGLKPYAIPVPLPRLGFGGGAFGALPAAASYLGLTNAQLFQQLASGKSLAQIAAAKGKTVSGLEQAMTAAEKKSVEQLLNAKAITQSQANQILKRWSSNLSDRVNGKGFGGPPFPLFRLFRMRPAKPMAPGYAVPVPPGYAVPVPPGDAVPVPPGYAVPVPPKAQPGALPQAAPAVPVPSA